MVRIEKETEETCCNSCNARDRETYKLSICTNNSATVLHLCMLCLYELEYECAGHID